MANISSIDDLLMGVGNSQQPATPEHKDLTPEPIEMIEDELPDYEPDDAPSQPETHDEPHDEPDDDLSDDDSSQDVTPEPQYDEDEYGNRKERMPKGMKDRLDRKDRQHQQEVAQRDREIEQLRAQLQQQGATPAVQQAAQDFQYDPDDNTPWQQQLAKFVRQEINNMTQEQVKQQRDREEQAAHQEFQKKFAQGMDRFDDFREVVGAQPIDDAMTLSLRGMQDPSAFIYAASKRQPQELERISKLRDPYARMFEMGKLEERMRRNKPVTKAPRPLGRAPEDSTTNVKPKQKDLTGDDLLAKADAKRLANVRSRHKANR